VRPQWASPSTKFFEVSCILSSWKWRLYFLGSTNACSNNSHSSGSWIV
jgi:hypothetical protein